MGELGEVLEEYAIIERPRVAARIVEFGDGSRMYMVVEPGADDVVSEGVERLSRAVMENPGLLLEMGERDLEDAIEYLLPRARRVVGGVLASRGGGGGGLLRRLRALAPFLGGLPPDLRREWEEKALGVAYYVARDTVGFGAIDPLLRDPWIEDITCNGVDSPVYVFHGRYEWLRTNIVFNSPEEAEKAISILASRSGKEPTVAKPVVEGVIRGLGFRVNIVLDVVSRRGHSFTIRKAKEVPFTIVDLVRSGMLSPRVASFLWLALQYKQGIIVYGPTGSGKTTLVNALTMLVPPEYKIVSVEDTPEINLPFHENWISMVTRLSSEPHIENVTLQAQIEAAMRQRPDILIVGEIRSREAYAFFQALFTGHGGITTIHAESADTLIKRLSTPPMNVPLTMIAANRLYVRVSRMTGGDRRFVRRVSRIDETVDFQPETGRIVVEPRVVWDPRGEWVFTEGDIRTLSEISELFFIPVEDLYEEWDRRSRLLDYAARRNLDIFAFQSMIRRYLREPGRILKEIEARRLGG